MPLPDRELEEKLASAEQRAKAAEDLNSLLRTRVRLLEERLEFIDPLLGAVRVVLKYAALAETEILPTALSVLLFGAIDSLRLIASLFPKPKHIR